MLGGDDYEGLMVNVLVFQLLDNLGHRSVDKIEGG